MDNDKQRQEISLIGRLFSMEALIFLMGIISLYYGFSEQKTISIFWGVIILCGVVALHMVRKKDWKKHFDELEADRKAKEAYQKRKDGQRDE